MHLFTTHRRLLFLPGVAAFAALSASPTLAQFGQRFALDDPLDDGVTPVLADLDGDGVQDVV